VQWFVEHYQPIQLVLPAFPAEIAEPGENGGALPDYGEVLALKASRSPLPRYFLLLCAGATLVICSDGRVFSDLVRVSDEDVNAYAAGIRDIIRDTASRTSPPTTSKMFSNTLDYDGCAKALVDDFGATVEEIRRA